MPEYKQYQAVRIIGGPHRDAPADYWQPGAGRFEGMHEIRLHKSPHTVGKRYGVTLGYNCEKLMFTASQIAPLQ